MHIVVAGASGGTGRQVITQGIEAGHRVTALVRDASQYQAAPGVEVQQTDVFTENEFDLPEGVNVVISALGNHSFKKPIPVCQHGTAHLLAAMRRKGVRRIVAVSAAPVLRSSRVDPWWFRATMLWYVRWTGRHVYADLANMETVLGEAGDWCRWTIVRPGFLTDADAPGEFQLREGDNLRGSTPRPDLAAALLSLARDDAAVCCAYGIATR